MGMLHYGSHEVQFDNSLVGNMQRFDSKERQ